MGENGSLSASDIALLSDKGGCGWADNSFMWIFALLILANGGFGFGGNNFANAIGYENLATSNEVQRGFDAQNSMANEREILSAVNAGTAQAVGATNQVYHDIVSYVGDKYDELARDIYGVGSGVQQAIANQNECCCSTKMLISELGAGINANIAQSRYDAAMNTAAINANTTAQTQKILDAITGNRMADMQNQINALELQNQLATVVRYPSNTFYAVPSPCFNTGCGCGNI
ncbi:MAG: hypothetical protein J6T34_00115 [Bacilli bacterium]|nr:hypothetical protein [Bacilli bacterium]